jgi:uncharacterized protein YjbI with pentapeptide repeats
MNWEKTRERLIACGVAATRLPMQWEYAIDLSETDLREANLCWANLRGTDLREANLCEANLRGADLRGADLREANLCEANLCWADLREANLCGADLHEANLREADLREANLREANLCWANLRGTDLREANLCEADLRGANLREADLRGADLDFSAWPLWCGSLRITIDEQQARQLAYHLAAVLPAEVEGDWVDGLREFADQWDGIERYGLKKLGAVR